MNVPDIIIAIDGYSSTGKSSFAKLLASRLGFLYLDSGALYRGVTLFAVESGLIDADGRIDLPALKEALSSLDLHFVSEADGSKLYMGGRCIEKEIRSLAISDKVSPVSAIPFVREYVDGILREAGRRRRIVMDGRDIGTTVFPDAELKVFVNAPAETRAMRRYLELQQKGDTTDTYEAVLENVRSRDHQDETRAVSPLRRADDAIDLDNSNMTPQQQLERLKELVHRVLER